MDHLSALALWCAVVVVARASAYTVDCDPAITDCAALLGKLSLPQEDYHHEETPTTVQTTTTTKQYTTTEEPKPQPRLLNLSVDELQNFANALHNQSDDLSRKISDLSDVTLDGDEDEEPSQMEFKNKLANRFFTNLRQPFSPVQASLDKKPDEVDSCTEKEASYKIGEIISRGCEESCECMPGGLFDCSPRCKHPYIRIGKSLNDPLCFESPVDDCCSIIACSTGSEMKGVKIEVCRHLNDTYQLGAKWHIGCEQTCTCEKNSVVTCKPRCSPLPPSDKCINVQDPKDECCEVQVCDVSQDVHEVPENSTSTTTTTQTPRLQELTTRTFSRPLVLPEPIGSIKVLQNNTVRVNLIHPNNTEDPIHLLLSNDGGKTFKDVELTYSNLILNLKGGKEYILKTKETGTKFNFTITAMDNMSGEKELVEKIGCHHDGAFYAVGEEFHIGCTELCECTGKETRECAALACPSHVGLELISKGCVRWAPSPPAEPPNCCPRSARCLSDGTCHYKGVPVPNWSEVPIALTGCEERCFCENGELDCQEICSPLSPLPPQTLRCPSMHRPAPVNISDDDCCKQWGCEPNAHHGSGSNYSTNDLNIFTVNYVTPYSKTLTTLPSFILPTPAEVTDATKFYKHLHIDNTFNKPKTLPMPFNIEMESVTPNKMLDINPMFNSHGAHKKPVKIYLKPSENIHQMIEQSPHINKGRTQFETQTRKGPLTNKNDFSYNLPSFNSHIHKIKPEIPPYSFFQPGNYILPTKPSNSLPSTSRDYTLSGNNEVTVLHTQDWKDTNFDDDFWSDEIKSQSSKRTNNPYETVLLKVPKTDSKRDKPHKNSSAQNSVNEMDIESLMSKNLERSTNKNSTAIPGHAMMPTDFTPKPPPTQQQSFLPTIPPEIHFPQDDIAEYDQNNIHRPVNPLVPGNIPGLPPGLHVPPNYGEDNKKLSVISLQSDSPTSVKMLFGLPPVLVGLRGSVDLRYTDKPDEDISQWYSQVFAPADEVLTTPRLEFRLTGLKPSTPYKIRGKLYLHNLPVEPESEVYAVRTQDLPTMPPVEEKRREIDSKLTVVDANDTTAHISWRHFSEDELQFIDGIQVRYRPVGTPIYSMTELLHHSKTLAELHSLRPGSRYEASLVLIPPPRATTELHDPGKVEFNTASYIDPYNWSVTVEAVSIGSIAAELTWRGIPSPPERWVRVYRAASTCGERDSSAEHDAFRLAHRDITPKLTLTSLLPDTRCRVWLELFLTNGKVKTSNVLEIHTKSLDSPQPIDNEIEAASISGGRTVPRGDYYGALVVVGVVAALGAVTSLLLLLVVVRRHRPRSVPITSVPSAPRESSLPPYDNPAYKLELQQETMDL